MTSLSSFPVEDHSTTMQVVASTGVPTTSSGSSGVHMPNDTTADFTAETSSLSSQEKRKRGLDALATVVNSRAVKKGKATK